MDTSKFLTVLSKNSAFEALIKASLSNNNAERALRELIVQRKIIGGLRREKGARIMEVITSVIATTKIRQQPLFQTIKSYL